MKRLLCVVIPVSLLLAGIAPAQDVFKDKLGKSPRHHEWITVKSKTGHEVKVFVVFPEVKAPATAVVVIHENKGLTDWVRLTADEVAEAGYIALAPDLLTGMGPGKGDTDAFKTVDDATKALYKLDNTQVMEDLDAVVALAKTLKASNKKVAVGGFCWGGGKTFAYAAHNPNIAAAFVFYGTAPKKKDEMTHIKATVYGFYGEKDARITEEVPDVEKEMKAVGKKYDPVVYKGAGHGFMRSGATPDAKNKADITARQDAWKRWKEILKGL
jgi:carboxymethylenebutenolidase